jgi:hypothetical protein
MESRYSFYFFLTSSLDGGEWSASRPARVYPEEEALVDIGQETGFLVSAPHAIKNNTFITKFSDLYVRDCVLLGTHIVCRRCQ